VWHEGKLAGASLARLAVGKGGMVRYAACGTFVWQVWHKLTMLTGLAKQPVTKGANKWRLLCGACRQASCVLSLGRPAVLACCGAASANLVGGEAAAAQGVNIICCSRDEAPELTRNNATPEPHLSECPQSSSFYPSMQAKHGAVTPCSTKAAASILQTAAAAAISPAPPGGSGTQRFRTRQRALRAHVQAPAQGREGQARDVWIAIMKPHLHHLLSRFQKKGGSAVRRKCRQAVTCFTR
jgi:hypothetical protein